MATVKRTSPTSLQVIKPDCLVATLYTGATTETADNPAGDPAAYQKTYVKIDLVFKNGTDTDGSDKYMSICIPKLQLNSRLMVESMNSNIARLNLAGTATSVALTANGKTIKTAAYVNEDFTIPTETA